MAAPGVLGNDIGVGMTVALMDPTELGDDIVLPQGTLQLNVDGSFSYVPAPGFEGVDTFYFMVTDAAGNKVHDEQRLQEISARLMSAIENMPEA